MSESKARNLKDASDLVSEAPAAIGDTLALSVTAAATLSLLNEVAAQQLNDILAIAITAAEAAQTLEDGSIDEDLAVDDEVDEDENFAALIDTLKDQANEFQQIAREAGGTNKSQESRTLDTTFAAGYAETLATIVQAFQNAAANQQQMYDLSRAVLASAVSRVLSAGGQSVKLANNSPARAIPSSEDE